MQTATAARLDFQPLGGVLTDSCALRDLLAHARIDNPTTHAPFSEPLCFGLAGGIGAGYSFCPSVPRSGFGTGVTIIGRFQAYATGPTWFQGFFDRLGMQTHITETTAPGKAQANLLAELRVGRPTVVWCSRAKLPYLGGPLDPGDMTMYHAIVFGLDEAKDTAWLADRAASPVTLTLDQLIDARNAVCSHKNRTLTFTPTPVSKATLQQAVRSAIRLTAHDLERGKIKTFALPGLELWAKMLVNKSNKNAWRVAFNGRLLVQALRDVYECIVTTDAAGGLSRSTYAEFLDEAATLLKIEKLRVCAEQYQALAEQWNALADAALPSSVKIFEQTKKLLHARTQAFLEHGMKGKKALVDATNKLQTLRDSVGEFPLPDRVRDDMLEELSDRVLTLLSEETSAAQRLATAVA
jgi:hypothetical protein